MRILFALVAALILAACGGIQGLWSKGQSDYQAGRYAECAASFGQAIEKARAVLANPASDVASQIGARVWLGLNSHGRAGCHKALGRDAEALADEAVAVEHLNEACHRKPDRVSGNVARYCATLTSALENQAKWKKELAQGAQP